MKSKNITNIIIEGCDGVGKSTLKQLLLEHYNYRIPVYDRGEFSNFVYAKKYNRPFSAMQRHLPILYVLLVCKPDELERRIKLRNEDVENELLKINDQQLFLIYAKEFVKDYHLIVIDTTNKNPEQVLNETLSAFEEYQTKLNVDNEANYTAWNMMYKKGCDELGLEFKVRDNQPYINEIPFMGEVNLHNGVYETFDDKTYPHNLIYCLGYDQLQVVPHPLFRPEDFTYIINSKILTRHELYDYLDKFVENNLTCLVGSDTYMASNPLIKTCKRPVGDELIQKMATAKASIYLSRRMAYLEYLSVRLYENIIACNIIFVDKLSDPHCKILRQIHKDNQELIDLLYVTENTICDNYLKIINNNELWNKIIVNQNSWYDNLKEEVFSRYEKSNA